MEEKEIEKYRIVISSSGKTLMGKVGLKPAKDGIMKLLGPLTIGYKVNTGLRGVDMQFQQFDPMFKVAELFVKIDIVYYPNKNQIELYIKALGKEDE